MHPTRARIRPEPKICDQCTHAFMPLERHADGALHCPNEKACGYPPYWGHMSQVVSVVLQPVRATDGSIGLLYVLHNGRTEGWDLPAGFNPQGECARDCGARECEEEATFRPSGTAAAIPVDFETVFEGHGAVFHLFPIVDEADLPAFVPNDEKQSRRIGKEWRELRFSTHQQAARDFFAGRFDDWPARVP